MISVRALSLVLLRESLRSKKEKTKQLTLKEKMKKKKKITRALAFFILVVFYSLVISLTLERREPPLPDNITILKDGSVRIAIVEIKTP